MFSQSLLSPFEVCSTLNFMALALENYTVMWSRHKRRNVTFFRHPTVDEKYWGWDTGLVQSFSGLSFIQCLNTATWRTERALAIKNCHFYSQNKWRNKPRVVLANQGSSKKHPLRFCLHSTCTLTKHFSKLILKIIIVNAIKLRKCLNIYD